MIFVKPTLITEPSTHYLCPSVSEREAFAFIIPLSPDYPSIKEWFFQKVTPGIRCGTRKIIRIERYGQIAALGIAKSENSEMKICTVRVAQDFVGKGLGIRVFNDLMSWLGTDKPHATVSEVKLPEFQRIFDHYGFQLTSIQNGLYVSGRAEYLFNEPDSPLT